MKKSAPRCATALLAASISGSFIANYAAAAPSDDTPQKPKIARIEAHSASLLAVGIVHDDRMTIHLSRIIDNAPIRDAALNVLLRGVMHPTIAEADGSYTLRTKALNDPGSAVVEFQVAQGAVHETLSAVLPVSTVTAPKVENGSSARQLGWWILNFAVCIGFLMLISRRRKAKAA